MRISGKETFTPVNDCRIPSGKLIASDTETTGINPWKGHRAFCFSFCNEEGETGYVRAEVDPFTRKVIIREGPYTILKMFYEDPSIDKVFHNAKFDVRMLDMIGIKVRGRIHDTMFAMHCLNNVEPTLQLKPICKKYLEIDDDDEQELHDATRRARREAKKRGWTIATDETHGDKPIFADYWLAPDEVCRKYCIRDSERAMLLWLLLAQKMDDEGVRDVYEEEMKLWPVTYKMESRGVRVYPKVMKKYMDENSATITTCLREFKVIAPNVLNFNSPKQLTNFFYKECKLEVPKYTDAGNPSTDVESLLALKHPLARRLIDYKTALKAKDTFFGKFYELMIEEEFNGHRLYVIHPNFNQIGPATGRYSCRAPNLQNVADPTASRAPVPIPARMSFGPRPGYEWWHFDFKQMELWEFFSPAVANDDNMLSFMLAGGDVPDKMARDMGWEAELLADKARGTKQTRVKAKLTLYGIIYGIGIQGIAKSLKVSREKGATILYDFKKAYPKINEYMQQMQRRVLREGFVQGPLGRKFRVGEGREYAIVNYIVQGSGAQVVKNSMVDLDNYIQRKRLDAHLILTVHDEVAVEINKKDATLIHMLGMKRLLEVYGKPFKLPSLPVDVERVREYWAQKEDIDL